MSWRKYRYQNSFSNASKKGHSDGHSPSGFRRCLKIAFTTRSAELRLWVGAKSPLTLERAISSAFATEFALATIPIDALFVVDLLYG